MTELIIVLATFFAMEFVAWFTHKYVMHGFLWNLHNDHHNKDASRFFEKNDSFFLIFAVPSFFLILFGTLNNMDFRFWIGLGIAVYGFAYFLVHEVFIHQRFSFLKNSDNTYLRAIRKAHKVHHKHLDKEDGECFGMLLVPFKYFKEAMKAKTK
jgi:beta-carotene 3-hydroxylase